MNVKMGELKTLEICEKRYQLDKIGIVTEKNKHYYMSIAIKEVLKEILLLDSKDLELAIRLNKVYEKLDELIDDGLFLPLAKGEELKILSEQVERYIRYIKGLGIKVLAKDVVQDVNINGKLITVSADFVYEHSNGVIEVVKIKRTPPKLSYRARKFENMPKNNIELYLLQSMGEHLYTNKPVTASFHHLAGKDDKKTFNPVYNHKKGYNVINYYFKGDDIENVKKQVVELVRKTESNKFYRTDNSSDCRVCPYNNVCNYNKGQNVKLEPIKKVEKAPEDFQVTSSQLKAITFDKGVARINAGAGSGKTTVVALRVVELILAGCEPEDILLITFTNKGANEMREKINYWLSKEGIVIEPSRFNVTTFNAWGDKIIQENYCKFGFTEPPMLIEKVQKYDIIFELLEKNMRLEGYDYRNPVMDFRYSKGVVVKLSNIFDYIKAYNAITPKDLVDKVESSEIPKVLDMYNQYNEILKEKNLMEYQDQINLMVYLTEKEDDVLKQYNYKHIIVDEFQDTDAMQLDLVMFLSNQPNFKSLMVVGDDAQSIFGFRNTSQENILNFHLMFNEVKDIEIVENFRSTPEIIELANALNEYNTNKTDKRLVSGLKSGDVPQLVSFNSYEDEYNFIAKKIKELFKQGYKPEDIAIIARTKYELFDIEEHLKDMEIPYLMDVPEPLLNNTKIHMSKSLVNFLDNPEITQGLFEYLFLLTDGFEDMKENEIKIMIEEERELIKEVIEEGGEGIKLELFHTMLDIVKDEDEDFKKFINGLSEKHHDFNELKDYLYKFIEYQDNKTVEKNNERFSAVTLTTAHTSKGKEFTVVFTTISKFKTDKNIKAMEEERRTLFVSLTRAKEKLFITHQEYDGNTMNRYKNKFAEELADTRKCKVFIK